MSNYFYSTNPRSRSGQVSFHSQDRTHLPYVFLPCTHYNDIVVSSVPSFKLYILCKSTNNSQENKIFSPLYFIKIHLNIQPNTQLCPQEMTTKSSRTFPKSAYNAQKDHFRLTRRTSLTHRKALYYTQESPLLHTGKPVLAYNKVRFNPQKGLFKLRIRSTH